MVEYYLAINSRFMPHYPLNLPSSMKTVPYFFTILAFIAILAIPMIVGAEEAQVQIDTTVTASSSGPGVLQRMRTEVKVNGQNTQNTRINQDSRNVMRTRVISTTTASSSMTERRIIQKEGQQNVKDRRTGMQNERKLATTSAARREFRQDMELRMFEIHKEILVRQLNLALSNLKQIRSRIVSRMEKAEQSGRNMTEARAALKIADAKLGNAQTQINILANLTASSIPVVASSTTGTASSTATTTVKIKLEKPRQLGEAAIKAVKDARDALNLVIRAMAKNMGLGDKPATSATSSVSASASVSPSTTPSPTVETSPTPIVTP
jgi:hypothetical protein